jgi:hypothetical protein
MTLFDAGTPICPYCSDELSCLNKEIQQLYANGLTRQEISKKLNIYMSTVARALINTQTYICNGCNESIVVDNKLVTIISCRDLKFIMKEKECIIIHGGTKLSIPSFKINFSSKEKLYNKLKNYIIFS